MSELELRGFAPIGILEDWNAGMMGLNEFYRYIVESTRG
jgi:hypothetical protein